MVFVIGTMVVFSFVLTGCFGGNTDVQRSQAGYFAEDFLPPTTPLVVSYSTLDSNQRETFAALKAEFPQLADQSFESNFLDGLGFDAWNFNDAVFTEQLTALFANGTRLTFALDALPADSSQVSSISDSGKYIFAVVNDIAAAKTLFDQVAAQSNSVVVASSDETTQTPFYADITNNLFVALAGDLLIISDSETLLKSALVRGVQKIDALSGADAYTQAMENLPSAYTASLYFSSDSDFFQAFSSSPTTGPVIGEAFVFVAEDEGLKIEGYSKTDSAALQEMKLDRTAFMPQKLTLIDQLPGQNVVLASESKNLGGVLDFIFRTIAEQQAQYEQSVSESATGTEVTTPEATEDFYVSFKEKFKSFMGLDWDADVLTFLSQNYIIALSVTSGNVIPGLTIMADAKDNPSGAQQLIAKLDTQLEGLLMIVRLNAGTEGTDLFVKDTVQIGDAQAHRISVDFSKLSSFTGGVTAVPAVVSSQTFELTYGVTDNNIFFFSTHPNFANTYSVDVLSEQANYKAVADHISLKNGVFFMAPSMITGYLDAIVTFQESLNGPLAAEDKEKLEHLKSVLQAFSAVIVTSELQGDEVLTHGYVLIGQ